MKNEQYPPCEWCGVQWEPGKKPCSMLDARTLYEVSNIDDDKINDTCKAEAKKRIG